MYFENAFSIIGLIRANFVVILNDVDGVERRGGRKSSQSVPLQAHLPGRWNLRANGSHVGPVLQPRDRMKLSRFGVHLSSLLSTGYLFVASKTCSSAAAIADLPIPLLQVCSTRERRSNVW